MKKGQKKGAEFLTDPKLFSPRLEISWDPKYQPLLLQLPLDRGNSKTTFDFSSVRKKPFAFDIQFQEEPEKPEISIPKDSFEDIVEPKKGMIDESFNMKALRESRNSIPYVKYIPHCLRGDEAPLRPPEKFQETEKIMHINLLLTYNGNPQQITYVALIDIQLGKQHLKQLPKLLSGFPSLECLILRNVKLKDISNFPKWIPSKLKYCDMRKNFISDVKQCIRLFSKTTLIEIINLLENPVIAKPNFREKLIAINATLTLRIVNTSEVGIEERIRALHLYGTKQQKQELSPIRWDLRFASIPEVIAMMPDRKWKPEYIKRVELPNLGLSLFHIGDLKHLEYLDLSNNKITDIRGSGIEHCNQLYYLNLKNNLLSKKESLKAFCFTLSLRILFLEGNELSNYRQLIIVITRNLKGDNRMIGLVELDGRVITIEEKLNAIIAANKKENIDTLRWKYNLINYYGHYQLVKIKDFVPRIRHLCLPNRKLSQVYLKDFHSLEYLDLSGNNLCVVEGIERLIRLKFLNLFGNLRLLLGETLRNLAKTNSLEYVSFGVNLKDHKFYLKSSKYRIKVLKQLIFNNPNLRFLDGQPIQLEERVESYKALGATVEQAETYRFQVALTVNCTLPWNRRYHFTEVSIGNQYDPISITVLRRMNNVGLISSVCDFSAFKMLEELNLQSNKLTSIHKMGLTQLEQLRILDVSRNAIDTPLKELAAFLDKMNSLEVLAIYDNPVMRNFADRLALIGYMSKMKEVTCVLRVIDTEVTLDERVEAWRKNGGSEEERELMRYKAIMFQRAPKEVSADQLISIDLSRGGLEHLELGRYESLEVLLLKDNRLKTIDAIGGLSNLKKLKVLDLRKNQLAKLEEISALIGVLPSLVSLGLKGNRFCEAKNWRHRLISMLPQLHEEYVSFRVIDNEPISCLEIVKAWKVSSDASPDRVRFQVLKLLKVPMELRPEQVTELDFSSSELQLIDIDLCEYPNLRKLSLANNLIKSVEGANLSVLTELHALDLSGNKLKSIEPVVTLVNQLSKLEMIFLDKNPFWPSENDAAMRITFIGGITQLDHLGASLAYLNGYEIKVSERCSALYQNKVFNEEGIERFRLDLLWEKIHPEETMESLSLNGHEIHSIRDLPSRLLKLANLRHLDLSNNRISSLSELRNVLDNCIRLSLLDIRANVIDATLQELLSTIRSLLPGLTKLFIEGALRGKETNKPKEYASYVFEQIPSLVLVDNLPHPRREFDKEGRRFKSVFDLFDNAQPSGSIPSTASAFATDNHASSLEHSMESPPFTTAPTFNGPSSFPSSFESSQYSLFTAGPVVYGPPDPSAFFSRTSAQNGNGLYSPVSSLNISEEMKDFSSLETSSVGDHNLDDTDLPPAYCPPNSNDLYPDVGSTFTADSYLPKDYHQTIGRHYDLSDLARQLAIESDGQEFEEDSLSRDKEDDDTL